MRPKGLRQARFNELLKEELSLLLLTESADARLKFIILTQVTVTPDLKQAIVYYRTLSGSPEPEADRALEHAVPFLRHGLVKHLKVRALPTLTFRFDELPDKAAAIDRLLNTLHYGDKDAG
jgi:ribosome-binding factor A